MATEEEAINVDADAAADVPSSRIVRGNGDAEAPLEIASSDSEDESPAKRAKPAPAPAPETDEEMARRLQTEDWSAPAATPAPPQQTSIETFALTPGLPVAPRARPVPGLRKRWATIVDNVIVDDDAAALMRLSEQRPYTRAAVGGRIKDSRTGQSVWVDAPNLASTIFERVRPSLKEEWVVGGTGKARGKWRLVGLNERLRFLKYNPGEFFEQHPDGWWPRSFTNSRSFATLLLYLNEDYRGGSTTIWNATRNQRGAWTGPHGQRADPGIAVPPRIGMVLVHDHDLLHESPPLLEGVKYAIRTDVMYERV